MALDVRGQGDSAPPEDGNYAPASRAADVFAVLDGLGLHRVAIVGTVRCLYRPRHSSHLTAHGAVDPSRPTWRLDQGACRGLGATDRPLPEGFGDGGLSVCCRSDVQRGTDRKHGPYARSDTRWLGGDSTGWPVWNLSRDVCL